MKKGIRIGGKILLLCVLFMISFIIYDYIIFQKESSKWLDLCNNMQKQEMLIIKYENDIYKNTHYSINNDIKIKTILDILSYFNQRGCNIHISKNELYNSIYSLPYSDDIDNEVYRSKDKLHDILSWIIVYVFDNNYNNDNYILQYDYLLRLLYVESENILVKRDCANRIVYAYERKNDLDNYKDAYAMEKVDWQQILSCIRSISIMISAIKYNKKYVELWQYGKIKAYKCILEKTNRVDLKLLAFSELLFFQYNIKRPYVSIYVEYTLYSIKKDIPIKYKKYLHKGRQIRNNHEWFYRAMLPLLQ